MQRPVILFLLLLLSLSSPQLANGPPFTLFWSGYSSSLNTHFSEQRTYNAALTGQSRLLNYQTCA